MPEENTNYLQIPIDGDDIAGNARTLRKHQLTLQRMALENIDRDYLQKGELESMRAVIDLMIHLQEIEENPPTKSDSPP